MKIIILIGTVAISIVGIYVGTRLSDDALAMAIGFLFGVISGIPASLLLLASQRRQERREPREQQQGVPMFVLPYSGPVTQPPQENQVIDMPRLAPPNREVKRIEW